MKRSISFYPSLLAAHLTAISPAYACLCEPASADKHLADADLVVVGRAYETLANRSEPNIDPDRPETWYARAYRFAVLETKKAPAGLTVESGITVLDNAVCSSGIGLGELTILYANKRKNGAYWYTSSCSGTEPQKEQSVAASNNCSRPHSAKEAISQADAVFSGFVLSGETDSHFESHLYHYRVFVRDVWKASQVGQVVDVFWQQSPGSRLHIGSGYQFLVHKKNNQFFHDQCLEIEPSPKIKNYEERSRAMARIEGEFEQLRTGHLPDNESIPAREYASTKSGQLTSADFPVVASPQSEPSSDAGAGGAETQINPAVGSADKPSAIEGGPDRPPMATSCSRCSISTPAGNKVSLVALALAAILIRALRKHVKSTS